jgi:hypothetical protein
MNFKEELYIEDKRVDLYVGGKIQRTLTLNSLGNITAKQSSYSNTIKLPKTANNILIFEGLGIEGNSSTSPYKRLKCDYYYNKLPVFNGGYAIINSNNSDSFSITIYNGIIELGEIIKNKTLSDLNLSGLTHNLSVSDYQAIINDSDSPINYAIPMDNLERSDVEDYTFGGTNKMDYNLSETFPLIKVEYIFNQIIKEAGFTIEGDLFDDETIYNSFTEEYITQSEGYLFDAPTSSILPTISDVGASNLTVAKFESDPFNITFPISGFSGTSTSELIIGTSDITVNYNGNLDININIINGDEYEGNVAEDTFIIRIYNNSNLLRVLNYSLKDDLPINVVTSIGVVEGDIITFDVYTTSTNPNPSIYIDEKIVFDLELSFNFTSELITSTVIDGDKINLGDTKQLDFIKDVVNRYGLLLNKSQTSDVIYTRNISNLLKSQNDAIDYSNKLNVKKTETFTNSYAQENYFKFKYSKDEDSENDTSGFYDDSFVLDNKLASSEKTIFTSVFEILNKSIIDDSYFSGSSSTILNAKHPILKIVNEAPYYVAVEDKIKLVKLIKSSEKFDYTLKFYSSELPSTQINEYVNCVQLPKPFSEVFDDYYYNFIRVLENYKTIKVEFNFDFKDIYDFDFFKLIYLKQTGKYYYCNKLKYNVASTTVDAELVEIPFNGVNTVEPVEPVGSITLNVTTPYIISGTTYAIDVNFTFSDYTPTGDYFITAIRDDNGIGYTESISTNTHQFLIPEYKPPLTGSTCGNYNIKVVDTTTSITSNIITVNIPCN